MIAVAGELVRIHTKRSTRFRRNSGPSQVWRYRGGCPLRRRACGDVTGPQRSQSAACRPFDFPTNLRQSTAPHSSARCFVPGTVWIVWQGSRLGSADDYSLAVRRWTAGLQGFSHPRWNDLWRSRSRYGLRSTG